ncbi:putative ribosomal protein L13e [Rosa chinensis]|uniref:Putative ribosomal protein L13e n=1 Tax=Rosa chinensis TaxID=74649 RepID=A0A2P6SP11_ROSCH|nr:putative ribosomal protein L13e [Rosa chinensis]
MKHNNVILGEHFRKHRQNNVKTWLNEPAPGFLILLLPKITARGKAVKIFPRPTAGPLLPVVRDRH